MYMFACELEDYSMSDVQVLVCTNGIMSLTCMLREEVWMHSCGHFQHLPSFSGEKASVEVDHQWANPKSGTK